MNKKEIIKLVVISIMFIIGMTWCCFFSPWAKAYNRTYTEQEMFEMALEYDKVHGTDYAKFYMEN